MTTQVSLATIAFASYSCWSATFAAVAKSQMQRIQRVHQHQHTWVSAPFKKIWWLYLYKLWKALHKEVWLEVQIPLKSVHLTASVLFTEFMGKETSNRSKVPRMQFTHQYPLIPVVHVHFHRSEVMIPSTRLVCVPDPHPTSRIISPDCASRSSNTARVFSSLYTELAFMRYFPGLSLRCYLVIGALSEIEMVVNKKEAKRT